MGESFDGVLFFMETTLMLNSPKLLASFGILSVSAIFYNFIGDLPGICGELGSFVTRGILEKLLSA